jgi:flagellar biosynthesis component FlhA
MLLIFIRIKRTFLLFFFDLILNLATNKQKKTKQSKKCERTKNERERKNKEKTNEQRTNEQKTSEQRNERTIETNERDYKRMQF